MRWITQASRFPAAGIGFLDQQGRLLYILKTLMELKISSGMTTKH
jgi:hypothetical protein